MPQCLSLIHICAEAGIAVGDSALIVVDAKDAVQPGTIKAWEAAQKRSIPTIFFVNKLDEDNASFDQAYSVLRETFGKSVIPFEVPIMELSLIHICFSAVVLTQNCGMDIIKNFGFCSSRDNDKFAQCTYRRDTHGVPYPSEHMAARYSLKVVNCLLYTSAENGKSGVPAYRDWFFLDCG